jgi:Secretion system C-terminal sorting domain
MKNIIYSLVLTLLYLNLQAQTVQKTISMGQGYAQNVWYNLETDVETKGTAFGWDLAISMRGFDGSIFTNPFDTVYKAITTVANFATVSHIDTLPKTASRILFNSDTTWNRGALNNNAVSGVFDYGWGNYGQVTNNVVGDSIYIIKLSTGVWKKMFIEKLSYDTAYFIKYANLDGTSEQRVEISKKANVGKNFLYLNLTTNAVLDLEPKTTAWHLLFSRYHSTAIDPASGQAAPFVVSGVSSNTILANVRGVNVYGGSFVAKVTRKDTASDAYTANQFGTSMGAIGGDWKYYDYQNFKYIMSDSSTYFVKTPTGKVYKLIFKGFGGATNGNFIFSKEYMLGTSVQDPKDGIAALAVSPNPAIDGQIQVVFDLGKNVQQANFQLFNLAGQSVFTQKLSNTEGLQSMTLPSLGLSSGIYIARVNYDGKAMIQKVVVR